MSETVRLPGPGDLGVPPVALAEAADWASAGPGIPDYVIAQDVGAGVAPAAMPPPPAHAAVLTPPVADAPPPHRPPRLDYPSLGSGPRAGMDSYAPPQPPR